MFTSIKQFVTRQLAALEHSPLRAAVFAFSIFLSLFSAVAISEHFRPVKSPWRFVGESFKAVWNRDESLRVMSKDLTMVLLGDTLDMVERGLLVLEEGFIASAGLGHHYLKAHKDRILELYHLLESDPWCHIPNLDQTIFNTVIQSSDNTPREPLRLDSKVPGVLTPTPDMDCVRRILTSHLKIFRPDGWIKTETYERDMRAMMGECVSPVFQDDCALLYLACRLRTYLGRD